MKEKKELENKIKQIFNKELKDFQRDTVNRIVKRYREGQNRILISDEVGLGKTLIAKGTIAKIAMEKIKNKKRQFNVLYICSNLSIAEQNIRKLQIINAEINISNTSRLSKQHLYIKEKAFNKPNDYINLITLTPDTSFNVLNNNGNYDERALIYVHLIKIQELKKYSKKLGKIFRGNVSNETIWNDIVKSYQEQCKKIPNYYEEIQKELRKYLFKEKIDGIKIMDYIIDVLKSHVNNPEKNNKLIRHSRLIFCKISINYLKPDLVIMDEFQRYKYLISDKETEETELQLLFNKLKNNEKTRFLLLSATPYKMYSTYDEITNNLNDNYLLDDHYKEFKDVMTFLFDKDSDPQEWKNFEQKWKKYQKAILSYDNSFIEIINKKNEYQDKIYSVMCRTERKDDKNLIQEIKGNLLHLAPKEIKSYIVFRNLLNTNNLKITLPVDYIKSCPYLLSYMRGYKIKEYIEKKSIDNKSLNETKDLLWLKKEDIIGYKKISCNNTRLEYVNNLIFSENIHKLLWIPPTFPYYMLGGVYQNLENKNISKYIIFSSWEMVPRMLSTMLSYEAERKMISGKRKYNKKLYRKIKSKELKNISLLYPSLFLQNVYNPIDIINNYGIISIKEIKTIIKEKINQKLIEYKNIIEKLNERQKYLIILLLDPESYVRKWLNSISNIDKLSDLYHNVLLEYDNILKENYQVNEENPTKYEETLNELVEIALGSPAICTSRSYSIYNSDYDLSYPSIIGNSIVNKIDNNYGHGIIKSKRNDEYEKLIIKYCIDGCLQSVIDEYVSLLNTSNIKIIQKIFEESLDLRNASYRIDSLENFKLRINNQEELNDFVMRTNFAVAFADGDIDEKGAKRRNYVRNAFNSPFYPFILATTSIGQEGLDFHNYCRKIIHWNLPSNPIDLEQREGRINRYKCLAVRQNLKTDINITNIKLKKNIWQLLFAEKNKEMSDIETFWSSKNKFVKIERILPIYPYSNDEIVYKRIMEILNNYRITIGQPKQEELIDNLITKYNEKEREQLYIQLSPYYKRIKK